jgi:Lon protease (S16) C-terminal proteolytic domain
MHSIRVKVSSSKGAVRACVPSVAISRRGVRGTRGVGRRRRTRKGTSRSLVSRRVPARPHGSHQSAGVHRTGEAAEDRATPTHAQATPPKRSKQAQSGVDDEALRLISNSTLVTALASLVTGRNVRSDTAMMAGISLRGLVLPVGGIKETVVTAAAAGLTRVRLPALYRRDAGL